MASKSLTNRILTKEEMRLVLKDLSMLALRGDRHVQRLAFFRVCACCGLRASEIAGLVVGDINPFGPRPEINVRAAIAKGGVRRSVPLSWDRGTRDDIAKWHQNRLSRSGKTAPMFHQTIPDLPMKSVSRQTVWKWWKSAILILGPMRVEQIGGPHSGRHTFCTHALAGGRSLGEVRDAAGHSSATTTDIYVHALPRKGVADLWAFDRPPVYFEDSDERNESMISYLEKRDAFLKEQERQYGNDNQ